MNRWLLGAVAAALGWTTLAFAEDRTIIGSSANSQPIVQLLPPVAATATSPEPSTMRFIKVRAQSAADPLPMPRPAEANRVTPIPRSVIPAHPSIPVVSAMTPNTPCDCSASSDACTECNTIGSAPLGIFGQESVSGDRFWFSGEALLWLTKASNVPPLLTSSAPGGIGAIGSPLTTVLLSGDDLDQQFRPGARFRAGMWLNPCQTTAIEGSFFFTTTQKVDYSANSADFPGLFRPFFAVNPGIGLIGTAPGEFSEEVAGGTFSANTKSSFLGAEINVRRPFTCFADECSCRSFRADWFGGFRYLNLTESLNINENVVLLTPDGFDPAGTRTILNDSFSTKNNFYGGQLGTVLNYRRNRWSADLRTAVALGVTRQQVDIEGSQLRILPSGATKNFVGGLLAEPSNIGSQSKSAFAVVPEIGLNIGYQLTPHLNATIGYNFLYWSNVVRPGDQIDRGVDVTQIPNFVPPGVTVPVADPTRPAALFKQTDFWAQGITLGLEYRW